MWFYECVALSFVKIKLVFFFFDFIKKKKFREKKTGFIRQLGDYEKEQRGGTVSLSENQYKVNLLQRGKLNKVCFFFSGQHRKREAGNLAD